MGILITDAGHADFLSLSQQADDDYYAIYGDIVLAYRQHNKPETLLCVALAYCGGDASGCGAIRRFDDTTAELKRMFVPKPYRRRGIGERIACALEAQAAAHGFSRIVLETGADMSAAQALYKKLGYRFTDNYGPYAGDALCVCMEKQISAAL